MYPYPLLSNSCIISPIFWDVSASTPAIIDYSIEEFRDIDSRDQDAVESYNRHYLESRGSSWALWGYLEDRSHILRGTHIAQEWRIYHLGVDVIFPAGTTLYAPLDARVYEKWYEPWDGNYWGYIILEHTVWWVSFYALYGHLSYDSITRDESVDRGQEFARLGQRSENGNWFEHLHLQVFTGRDVEKWKDKWYCSLADLPTIKNHCPDPSFLIRY